jgi:hypothetical protein
LGRDEETEGEKGESQRTRDGRDGVEREEERPRGEIQQRDENKEAKT